VVETTADTGDVIEPDDKDKRSDIVAGELAESVDEACSPNVDEPASAELVDREVVDHIEENEDGRLSQREDSGIVNAEFQTAADDDAAVSSSSSDGDGDVMMMSVQQADVVVHASADVTPTHEGAAGHSGALRRPSADSTDR